MKNKITNFNNYDQLFKECTDITNENVSLESKINELQEINTKNQEQLIFLTNSRTQTFDKLKEIQAENDRLEKENLELKNEQNKSKPIEDKPPIDNV
jgi:predicted  nucleic acid-binding Zn-ribbon protein